MINLEMIKIAGPAIKTFAPKRSAKKFVMVAGEGDAVKAKIAEDVAPDQLPTHLGGTLDDAGQWDQLNAIKSSSKDKKK